MKRLSEAVANLRRAQEYLESAQDDCQVHPPRLIVAFENARTAAELAGKAMLATIGKNPRYHAIGGDLYQAGFVPPTIDPKTLSRLLKERTRADYGSGEPIDEAAAVEAITMASALVAQAANVIGTEER